MNKNLFEDALNHEEVEEDEDVFEKALKKKQFVGSKGHLLMELQTSYKNDSRFLMNKMFKDDIDVKKVSSSVKKMTTAFDRDKLNSLDKREYKKEEFKQEKNKNLSILSQVISNTEFLTTIQPMKYSNPKNFLIKRFDPKLNLGRNLVLNKDADKDDKEDKNLVKLQKGMNNLQEEDMLPVDRMRRQDKARSIQKEMNELQMDLEPKIEIKYNCLKNIFKKEENKDVQFSLFDGYIEKDNKSDDTNKIETISEIKENKKPEIKKKEKLNSEKPNVPKVKFNLFEDKPTLVNDPAKEESLLKKKRQKEKKKLKEKQKKEEQTQQIKDKDEKVEKKLKMELLKEFDSEKVDNYMRYVNLVREKKSTNKKK